MNYFSKFPNAIFNNSDGSISQVKDLLRRVVFTDESYLQDSNYEPYLIKDNETPDMVAQKFYDDPRLHWIIILYNTLLDPFYSFPLSRTSFETFIAKKYEGQALFLSPEENDFEIPFSSAAGAFEAGDKISTRYFDGQIEKFNNETQSAQIKRTDYGMSKIELSNQVGVNFAVGDVIARRKTILETIRGKVRKVIGSKFAPHHFEFENSKGEKILLNPMGTYPVGDEASQQHFGEGSFQDTLLHRYIYNDEDDFIITNQEHETRLNNQRKNILVPKKFIVQKINQEFESLVRK